MRHTKQQRLAAHGWTVGSVEEFLGLNEAESVMVELKLRLSDALRTRRTALGLTQIALANHIGSSQSRIAKMEAGASSVSLDLLVRALVSIGADTNDLAKAIRTSTPLR